MGKSNYSELLKALMKWLFLNKKITTLAACCDLSFATVNKWRFIDNNLDALNKLIIISQLNGIHDKYIQAAVIHARSIIKSMILSWDAAETNNGKG